MVLDDIQFNICKTNKIPRFIFLKLGDIKIIDRFGPDGISKIIKIISNKSTKC